jgi:hypothetical protein
MYQKLNEGNSWKKKKKWLVPSISECSWRGFVQFHNVGELGIELAGQQFDRDGSLWASLELLASLRHLMRWTAIKP